MGLWIAAFNRSCFQISVRRWCSFGYRDGKTLVCMEYEEHSGAYHRKLVRLDRDGTRDRSFNPELPSESWIVTAAAQPDGKILLGGLFYPQSMLRLNSDGSVDTTLADPFRGLSFVYNG